MKMKLFLYLFFIVMVSNINVHADEKPNVIITGRFSGKIPLFARIKSDDAALTRPSEHYARINPDSTFTIQFHISKPIPVTLINQVIFCEPGDSVHVLISGKLPFPKNRI